MECAVTSSRMRAYVRSDRRPEQEAQRGIKAGIKARAGLASSIYISFLLPAFRAMVFLDRKIMADRMAFDYSPHHRTVTLGAFLVKIKVQSHTSVLRD